MKRLLVCLYVFLFALAHYAFMAGVPAKPLKETFFVNLSSKFPDFLNETETKKLESRLNEINDQGNFQICIVIVDTLSGMEPNEFAVTLANNWGIGYKDKNNGVLIIVNPNAISERRVIYMAVGYELESVLPDLICTDICEYMAQNYFSKNKYYDGLLNAIATINSYNPHNTINEGEIIWGRISGHTNYLLYVICWFIVFLIVALAFNPYISSSSSTSTYKRDREDDNESSSNSDNSKYGGGSFGGGGGGSTW